MASKGNKGPGPKPGSIPALNGDDTAPRETGRVKWFSDVKGYGFITRDAGGKDVFVHFSAIAGDGHKTLADGDRVEFAVDEHEKGPQATRVVVLGG